jgi:hypothetical protein
VCCGPLLALKRAPGHNCGGPRHGSLFLSLSGRRVLILPRAAAVEYPGGGGGRGERFIQGLRFTEGDGVQDDYFEVSRRSQS